MSACYALPGCKNEAASGLYLCAGHLERLGVMLREVEDEAAILDARPSMAQRSGGGGSLASERTPVRLDVLTLRDYRTQPAGQRPPGPACVACGHGSCIDIRAWVDAYDARAVDSLSILDVLHSWARIVREERALSEPDTVTISSERRVLTRHLEWAAAQPWIDEAYGDIRTLLSQLRGSNGTGEDRPIGRCYRILIDGQCTGTIRREEATSRPWFTLADRCVQRDVDTADGKAYCDTCGHTWDGPQLAVLKWEIDEAKRPRTEDGRKMRTAEEIMREKNLSRTAFDVRAHRLRKAGLGGQSKNGYYDPAEFTINTPCASNGAA